MEARSKPKTRKERLKKIGFPEDPIFLSPTFPDKDIPEEFVDQYVTLDIMEHPIKVNGTSGVFIMDHASLLKCNLKKLQQWDAKTNGGASFYKIDETPVMITVGAGDDPVRDWEPFQELDNKIDAWLIKLETLYIVAEMEEELRKKEEEEAKRYFQELQLRQKARQKENTEKLKKIEADLEKETITLHALFHPECRLPLQDKEQRVNKQLAEIDQLNKAKNKLSMGLRYYDNAANLQEEINRLQQKKEMAEAVDAEIRDLYFTQEDREELAFCYKHLDFRAHRQKNLRFYQPRLFQRFENVPESPVQGFSIVTLRNSDEY